jgi:hypothetical protein
VHAFLSPDSALRIQIELEDEGDDGSRPQDEFERGTSGHGRRKLTVMDKSS